MFLKSRSVRLSFAEPPKHTRQVQTIDEPHLKPFRAEGVLTAVVLAYAEGRGCYIMVHIALKASARSNY